MINAHVINGATLNGGARTSLRIVDGQLAYDGAAFASAEGVIVKGGRCAAIGYASMAPIDQPISRGGRTAIRGGAATTPRATRAARARTALRGGATLHAERLQVTPAATHPRGTARMQAVGGGQFAKANGIGRGSVYTTSRKISARRKANAALWGKASLTERGVNYKLGRTALWGMGTVDPVVGHRVSGVARPVATATLVVSSTFRVRMPQLPILARALGIAHGERMYGNPLTVVSRGVLAALATRTATEQPLCFLEGYAILEPDNFHKGVAQFGETLIRGAGELVTSGNTGYSTWGILRGTGTLTPFASISTIWSITAALRGTGLLTPFASISTIWSITAALRGTGTLTPFASVWKYKNDYATFVSTARLTEQGGLRRFAQCRLQGRGLIAAASYTNQDMRATPARGMIVPYANRGLSLAPDPRRMLV